MYGRHLTREDYTNLLACRTVSEVAYYLKNNTSYAETLTEINESEVHRGRLEQFLRRRAFSDVAKLCIYDSTSGAHFSNYLVRYAEVTQLMHVVMYLASGSSDAYLFRIPTLFSHLVRLDLSRLAQVSSYADLLEAVERTPYYALLLPFRPLTGGFIDYTGIETALFTNLYAVVYDMIRQMRGRGASEEIKKLFDYYIDIENYLRIRRLKTLYHASPDYIRSCLFPYGSVRGKRLSEAINADTIEEVGKKFSTLTRGNREDLSRLITHGTVQQHLLYGRCLRNLRFSVYPSVTMISYFFLAEIEVQDIIHVIEGIRYGLPQNEIAELLTIINYRKSGGD